MGTETPCTLDARLMNLVTMLVVVFTPYYHSHVCHTHCSLNRGVDTTYLVWGGGAWPFMGSPWYNSHTSAGSY